MAFPGGVHVPSLTFFRNDIRQEIDWEVQEKHFEFLISSGLHGGGQSTSRPLLLGRSVLN
jgi:4-hydroxy-2-oxoglutarate aldolase